MYERHLYLYQNSTMTTTRRQQTISLAYGMLKTIASHYSFQ